MKSLIDLLKFTLEDSSVRCCTPTTRDFFTIARRVEHEGLSFLTITLGNFASDFERSLDSKFIDPSLFEGFSKKGAIPRLFSGMLGQVFDGRGVLLDQPSIEAIICIRQICRMWKKILIPCTRERELAAIHDYIECDADIASIFDTLPQSTYVDFGRVSDIIWSETLSSITFDCLDGNLVPQHGSGAVATKVLPNQKYVWKHWYSRLETFFPSADFCYANYLAFLEESSSLSVVCPDQEQPVRVVFVPKTLKAPRVIAVEPACMQYTQQALLNRLTPLLESSLICSKHINFSDQGINAKLALESSKSGILATLDLSEASDRVHKDVVYRMLKSAPYFRDAVFSCRSSNAVLPNGVNVPLQKFASMGSAMCFPIESMVFFTLLIQSELTRQGLPISRRNIELVRQNVYVYGDDLIIPVEGVQSATDLLSSFRLKVNLRKSFWTGKFRESCGTDAYDGVDVTNVYVRRMLPRSRSDTSGLLSAVSLSNQLHIAGFFRAALYVEEFTQRVFSQRIPYCTRMETPCAAFVRDYRSPPQRWNVDLQRGENLVLVVVPKRSTDIIDSHSAFMKFCLKGFNPDKKNLMLSVGTGRLTLKRRWTSLC